MSTHSVNLPALGLALCIVAGAALANGPDIGKPLNEADIAAWDISIQPDGKGLPPGGGTAAQGAPSSPKNAPPAMVRRARAGSPASRPRHYRH